MVVFMILLIRVKSIKTMLFSIYKNYISQIKECSKEKSKAYKKSRKKN